MCEERSVLDRKNLTAKLRIFMDKNVVKYGQKQRKNIDKNLFTKKKHYYYNYLSLIIYII